ncbi:MAG: hypothetical protein HY787_04990 [Deltaproteobacteria bacterium]|nr:hypothetical protein [Deltaproteobacteria bacterium]
MICPNCHLDQPDGKEKCPRCGIIFAKWEALKNPTVAKRFPPGLQPQPVKADLPQVSKIPALALWGLRILFLSSMLGGWYWFLVPPPRLPVPEKAYTDKVNAFALTVPPEWKGRRVKNCGGPHKSCEVFVATQSESPQQVKPAINIVVIEFREVQPFFPWGSILFTEDNKDEYAQEALKGIESVLSSHQIEGTSVIKVDAIPSLRVTITGTYSGQLLRQVFLMIPGSSRLYLLSYIGAPENSSEVDGLIQSFRVLEPHPSRFKLYGSLLGSLKGNVILGFLIGLSLATFRLFFRDIK